MLCSQNVSWYFQLLGFILKEENNQDRGNLWLSGNRARVIWAFDVIKNNLRTFAMQTDSSVMLFELNKKKNSKQTYQKPVWLKMYESGILARKSVTNYMVP